MGCNIMKQITPNVGQNISAQVGPQFSQAAAAQFTHGVATQGPWLLAWASQVGSRHLANGKPCEDSLGHRFHANQSIALALGDGVSGGAAGEVASLAAVRYCTDFGAELGDDFGYEVAPPANDSNDPSDSGVPARPRSAQTTLWDGLPPAAPNSLSTSPATSAPTDSPTNPDASPIQTHLNGLDEHVQQAIAQHTGRAGASTLAAAWLGSNGAGWLTHLGDVRAYRIAAGAAEPERLTMDHTYANLKEEPPPYVPLKNPARMVGNGIAGTPPLQTFQLEVGQALLLCTDGLHGFVTDVQINDVLARNAQAAQANEATQSGKAIQPRTAMAMARRLARLAVKQGSDDDIAVLLLWRVPGAAQTED